MGRTRVGRARTNQTLCTCVLRMIGASSLQVLVTVDGVLANVLKVKPPMVFSAADADKLLLALHSCLERLSQAESGVRALDDALMAKLAPGQRAAGAYFESLLRADRTSSCTVQ